MQLYYKYSDFLKEKFSEKIYKLPISLDLTCPNRDGRLGYGGCIFCSEEGGSHENLDKTTSVRDQLEENKAYIGSRYGAKKFIAYLQSFTNTYMDLEDFKKIIGQIKKVDDIVGINIATRPDSISDDYIAYLKELNRGYLVTVELGLQSTNNQTLVKINRGHLVSDFVETSLRLKEAGLRVCAHLILNLPWDEDVDILEAARLMNLLSIDEIKLHSLYITENTALGQMYKDGLVEIGTDQDYKDRVKLFLSNLNEDIVIQRLIGRVPEEGSLFANWGRSWWAIRDEIEEEMKREGLYQGKYAKNK